MLNPTINDFVHPLQFYENRYTSMTYGRDHYIEYYTAFITLQSESKGIFGNYL